MSVRQQAEGAPYHLVTSMDECPLDNFWVVLVNCDGKPLEVYQSEIRPDLDEHEPWMRLKRFCNDNGFSIINMAYANKNLDANKQINLDPTSDGFFYSKRIRMMSCANPRYQGYQDSAQGVGQLKDNKLTIYWLLDDGRREIEEREVGGDKGSQEPISLIRK